MRGSQRTGPAAGRPGKGGAIKGIVIAGTHSGCGKTTVSLGIAAALARRGLRVAPFKVGPDFIDPGHHGRAAGRPCRNLDGWMLSRDYNVEAFTRAAETADIAVVEGVMGLFDGIDGTSAAGSTAQMAAWLKLPVLLVVDARSMARSAAALVQGFENFDPGLEFAGVVFNRLGSPRHLELIREALSGRVRMPCRGGLLRDEALAIPERHLGLTTVEEAGEAAPRLKRLADQVALRLDLDGILAGLPETAAAGDRAEPAPEVRERVRIGVARDEAFCFYYPDNLELLERYGAEIVRFSPIRDRELPPDLGGLYLGGGYPELHAPALSANAGLRGAIRAASEAGMPIYAECGGFMYLCAELHDRENRRFPMAGVFPFATRMLPRLKALGYREMRFTRDTVVGERGMAIRGHEFHYSELLSGGGPAELAAAVAGRSGEARAGEAAVARRTLASYVHLHFGSAPRAAANFVENCRYYRVTRSERKRSA
jgi:cobyrinic acid a,c-diamide synthase